MNEKQNITVTVTSPRSTETKTFTWPKPKRVGEAAAEAATAFGHTGPGTPGFMNADDVVLDNQKPLVAAGVRDGDVLELTDTGGGV